MSFWDYIPTPAAQLYNLGANGKVFGQDAQGAKDWLMGGKATQGMSSGPQSADYQRNFIQNDFMNRAAPQMNTAQSDQARGQQNQLAQMLFAQSTGQAPGAGEMAVRRGVGQAMAQQTSAAQMARGANAMLAARNAARATADIGVNGAGQAAQAQMMDQANARSQLSGVLGGMRGQDIQTAGANQTAQMQQQQLQLSALAQMLGVDQTALQQDLAKRNLQMQDKGMLPSLLQMGGTALAAYAGAPGMGAGGGGGSTPLQSYAMPRVSQPTPVQGYRSPNDSYILGPGNY